MINQLDIEKAHRRIEPFIHFTPVVTSNLINESLGLEVFFKCENFQKIGAFKMRGATNAILKNKEQAQQKGVITHSSGNHAQALAKAAQLNEVKAYVVMPEGAPNVKVEAVQSYGAEVIFCENNMASRVAVCEKYQRETGAYYIAPYDDWDVIEGQATAAKELLEEHKYLDAILVPLGGGGLCAGTILTAQAFSPKTQVYGVEPLEADDGYRSFKTGSYLINDLPPQTIADGLKTNLGLKNWSVIQNGISDVWTVKEDEIVNALKWFISRTKVFIEPSSAVPIAGLIKNKEDFQGKKVGIILSGGNMDLNHLPF